MRLVQFKMPDGSRQVGRVSEDGNHLHPLEGDRHRAGAGRSGDRARRASIADAGRRADRRRDGSTMTSCCSEGRVLAPLDHPEPARFLVTGTGLTHTGSAAARNQMHVLTHGEGRRGIGFHEDLPHGAGGRQAGRRQDRRPARMVLQGRRHLRRAARRAAADAGLRQGRGEEAEIVGLYIVDAPDGHPYRIGYALGNEFSDHVTEARELSLSRPFQAALLLDRAGTADRRAAEGSARPFPHPARRHGALGAGVPVRRDAHVALDRQSRALPFPLPDASAGRATCTPISSARR